mmetsp:Transcript_20709/g.55944  ORF Transcript_20709/g.55944 Transcript_20709/m.55944 type:complete len:261 (-) Transcript_20709:566-1348(-)
MTRRRMPFAVLTTDGPIVASEVAAGTRLDEACLGAEVTFLTLSDCVAFAWEGTPFWGLAPLKQGSSTMSELSSSELGAIRMITRRRHTGECNENSSSSTHGPAPLFSSDPRHRYPVGICTESSSFLSRSIPWGVIPCTSPASSMVRMFEKSGLVSSMRSSSSSLAQARASTDEASPATFLVMAVAHAGGRSDAPCVEPWDDESVECPCASPVCSGCAPARALAPRDGVRLEKVRGACERPRSWASSAARLRVRVGADGRL